MELGTHGAHPRAGGFGTSRFFGKNSRRRSATCSAANEIRAASPPTSSKCAQPSPRKRTIPIRGTSNMPPAHWSTSNSSRSICNSSMPRRRRKFSTLRRRGRWKKPARLGVLKPEDAEVLRAAVRLFHDLTQILRLCLPAAFDPKTAGTGVLALLARAADLPDFPALQAHVEETQRQVRECFVRILGNGP